MQTKMKMRRRGAFLVIVAVAMICLLAVTGLAIDGGNLYLNRRQVQNAVDAGALAGAFQLSLGTTDDATILAAINNYVGLNGVPNAAGSTTAFYTDDNNSRVGVALPGNTTAPQSAVGVQVVTNKTVATYFIRVVGIPSVTASARASAKFKSHATTSNGGAAVFAHSTTDADAIKTTGPDYNFTGTVHSNAGITNSGGGYVVNGQVEYVTSASGVNKWSITSPYTASVSTVQPYPVSYQTSDYAPGSAKALAAGTYYHYINGSLVLKDTVAPGLYYVTGNVTGSSKFTADGVTIVTLGSIAISSPESTLSSYVDGLAMMSNTSGQAIAISSGGASSWTGCIFAPNGHIHFSMPNGVETGGLIAETMDITGPNAIIKGATNGGTGNNLPPTFGLYE